MIPRIFFDIAGENDYAGHFDMTMPFIDDPWLFATDARIMVRMPAALLTRNEVKTYKRGTRKLIPIGRTIEVWNQNTDSLARKSIDLPAAVEDRETCRSCYPRGEWTWPFIPQSDRYCEHCEGDGWNWIVGGIDLGSCIMNRKYISLLIKHGVSSITPGKDPHYAVHFRGDGFEGIVMPYDPDRAKAYAEKSAQYS